MSSTSDATSMTSEHVIEECTSSQSSDKEKDIISRASSMQDKAKDEEALYEMAGVLDLGPVDGHAVDMLHFNGEIPITDISSEDEETYDGH